jgi:hypothetical protein
MKNREEWLQAIAANPEKAAEEAALLQQQLAQAQSLIAELKQQLFGSKSEKLTPEQEAQLAQVAGDMQDQEKQDASLVNEVWFVRRIHGLILVPAIFQDCGRARVPASIPIEIHTIFS